MPSMARIPFVRIVKGRYAYFRTKETGDVRMRGTPPIGNAPGSADFHRHYAELVEEREKIRAGATGPAEGSWAWLIGRYLASAEYDALADSTQLDYARTCQLLVDELGGAPYRFTTKLMLKTVRDDLAATPRKAHKVKQMVSRLYTWAAECDLVPEGFNPAGSIKRLKRKGGDKEIVAWSDYEIAKVFAAAPAHLRTPLMIALFTGQRREDVVTMTWQQWQDTHVRVRTSKTRVLIDMPCHPELCDHLKKARRKSKVVTLSGPICLTEEGVPFTPNGLSGQVRRLVAKLEDVPDNRSMHGIRYAAGARMEEGGATHAMIAEVLGHQTFRMALKYAGGRVRAAGGVTAMAGMPNDESGNRQGPKVETRGPIH